MFLYLLLFIILLIVIKVYIKLTIAIVKCSKHLVGKVVIVTGGNAGIGYETAKDLAYRGARVIIACRNERRGTTARDKIIAETGNPEVFYRNVDLASLTSVRKFAEEIIKTEKRLDILINNAGVVQGENVKTEDGLHLGMQINHFGPFLLTNLLLPLLKSSTPSRIITLTSKLHHFGKIDFQNLNMEKESKETYSSVQLYANTKLANVMMTVELKRLLEGTGVTANCVHPGLVYTGILDEVNKVWVKFYMLLFKYAGKTPWEGAQTTIYVAVSPELNNVSGRYFEECREAKFKASARNPDLVKKLWEVSECLVNKT